MSQRLSNITQSIKQLGEIQVTEWDFMELLNKDLSELEIGQSLRRLGNKKVTDWDFNTVMPAVSKFANQEIDVVGLVKKAAHYKVVDWEFRATAKAPDPTAGPSYQEMQALTEQLKNFLQYTAVNLIDEPKHAQIQVQEIDSNVIRFKLVLVNRDVAMLIGKEGHTASAIRNILKAKAAKHGVHVLLEIVSHEDANKAG